MKELQLTNKVSEKDFKNFVTNLVYSGKSPNKDLKLETGEMGIISLLTFFRNKDVEVKKLKPSSSEIFTVSLVAGIKLTITHNKGFDKPDFDNTDKESGFPKTSFLLKEI